MSDTTIHGASGDFKSLMQRYADIQKAAYTSQSAKSNDIKSLHDDMASYFEAHPDVDSSKKDKVLNDLGSMETMAQAHEADHSHTDNGQWDNARSELDGLIKELAPASTDTSVIDNIPRGGSSGGAGSGVTNYSVSGQKDGDGSGAGLNYNDPSNSKDYKGQSIDQLQNSQTPLGDAMRKNPDLVNAIKQASQQTGVPAGLIAATAYAESSFGSNASTTYDADGDATKGVFQMSDDIKNKYNPGSGDSMQDNVNSFARALADQHNELGSWGAALRWWNSGEVPSKSDLSAIPSANGQPAGTPDYVTNILGKIAMGNPSS